MYQVNQRRSGRDDTLVGQVVYQDGGVRSRDYVSVGLGTSMGGVSGRVPTGVVGVMYQ